MDISLWDAQVLAGVLPLSLCLHFTYMSRLIFSEPQPEFIYTLWLSFLCVIPADITWPRKPDAFVLFLNGRQCSASPYPNDSSVVVHLERFCSV